MSKKKKQFLSQILQIYNIFADINSIIGPHIHQLQPFLISYLRLFKTNCVSRETNIYPIFKGMQDSANKKKPHQVSLSSYFERH